MALLTIDASIAVKFLVDEQGSEQARQFFPRLHEDGYWSDNELTAPTFMMIETHHVLAKKIRAKTIHPLVLSQAYPRLKQFVKFTPLDVLNIEASRQISMFGKARASGAPSIYPSEYSIFNIYDCVYISHAMANETTLVTADAELARIARDGFFVPVILIDVEALKQPN
jgi:predicted nucleic acid-binding protein